MLVFYNRFEEKNLIPHLKDILKSLNHLNTLRSLSLTTVFLDTVEEAIYS